jgi:hypothetical protein
MRPIHVPCGKRDRRRSWARSHAGRASCSLPGTDGDPAGVNQGAQVAGERRLVQGRQPAESPLAYFSRGTQAPQERVLGRAQADVAQFLVVQPAHRPGRLAQGIAKAGGGGRFVSLVAHTRCICMQSAVVKGVWGSRRAATWSVGRTRTGSPRMADRGTVSQWVGTIIDCLPEGA